MIGTTPSRHITWLASYPKSGNTWMRMFVANYLRNAPEPVGINDRNGLPMAAARAHFDRFAAVGAADLTFDEIDLYRPDIYRALASATNEPVAIKVHDAFRMTKQGVPLFPADVTRAVIYIVRDPRDVAVSLAYHRDCSMSDAVEEVCRSGAVIAPAGGGRMAQVPQRIGSWSEHVESWLAAKDLPVLCVRFEDLLARPWATFGSVVRMMGFLDDDERLERAIRFSSFRELQTQEQRDGFRERLMQSTFFRSGQAGGWLTQLSKAQADTIEAHHRRMMLQCGYVER